MNKAFTETAEGTFVKERVSSDLPDVFVDRDQAAGERKT